MPTFLQRIEQRQHAIKKRQIVGMQRVVVTVARAELGVLFLRHIGGRMRQRLHQPKPDDVTGGFVAGKLAAHIHHGRLDAAHDDFG